LLDSVLPIINSLNEYLQSKAADTAKSLVLVDATKKLLSKMRDDNEFEGLLVKVDLQVVWQHLMGLREMARVIERTETARLPAHLSDSVVMSTTGSTVVSDPQNMHLRQQMFAVIDRMIGKLTECFSSNAPELLAVATVNPGFKSFLIFSDMPPLAESFSYIGAYVDRLRGQSSVASNMFENAGQVTNAEQVLCALLALPCALRDLILFIQIVLTAPVSSANAERSFSTMKRMKTYLRSTMSDPRLNHLCLPAIEREISEVLLNDPSPVVDRFAALKTRRLSFLHKH